MCVCVCVCVRLRTNNEDSERHRATLGPSSDDAPQLPDVPRSSNGLDRCFLPNLQPPVRNAFYMAVNVVQIYGALLQEFPRTLHSGTYCRRRRRRAERAGGRASAARPSRSAMDPGYVNPYLQPAFVRDKGGSATVILRNRYRHTHHTHASSRST